MSAKTERKYKSHQRRKYSVRRKVFGEPDRPRLTVYRSNKHVYAQIIDDVAGVTLVAVGTRDKNLRDDISTGGNKEAAEKVGAALAKEAVNVGIKAVRFDRNGYRYQGRVRALADAARKNGLVF